MALSLTPRSQTNDARSSTNTVLNISIDRATLETTPVWYTVTVSGPGRVVRWTVRRRYADFHALHNSIASLLEGPVRLPPKGYLPWRAHDPLMVEERRRGLERYLRQIMAMQRVYEENRVWHFLEASAEVSIIVRYAWSKNVGYLKLLCPLSLEPALATSIASCRPLLRALLGHVGDDHHSIAGSALAVLEQVVSVGEGSGLICEEGGIRVLMAALGRSMPVNAVKDVLLNLLRSRPESMFLYFQVDGGLSEMLDRLAGSQNSDVPLCIACALVVAVAGDPDLEIALTDRQSSGLQLLECLMAVEDLATRCITGLIISALLRRGNATLLPHRDRLWHSLGEQAKRVREVVGSPEEMRLFEALDAVLDEGMEGFVRLLLSDNDVVADLTCNLLTVYFRGPLPQFQTEEGVSPTTESSDLRNERCWGRLYDMAVERLRWLVDDHGNVAASEALLACHGWCEGKSVTEQTAETRVRCVELAAGGGLAEKHDHVADSSKRCELAVEAQGGDVRRRGAAREWLEEGLIARLVDAFQALNRVQMRLTASWDLAGAAARDSRKATDRLLLTRGKLLTMGESLREKDINSLARERAEVTSAQHVVVSAEDQLGKCTSAMADAKRVQAMTQQALSTSAELLSRANARLADIQSKQAIVKERLDGVPVRRNQCLKALELAREELHTAEDDARHRGVEAENASNASERVAGELREIESTRDMVASLLYRVDATQADEDVNSIWADIPSWLTTEALSSPPAKLEDLRGRVEEFRLIVENRVLTARREVEVARDQAAAAKELAFRAKERETALQERCRNLETELADIEDTAALEKKVEELQEAERRQVSDVERCKSDRAARAFELSEQRTRVEAAENRVEEAVENLRAAERDRDSKSQALRTIALETDARLKEIESRASRLIAQTVRTELEVIMAAQHGCMEVNECLRLEEEIRNEALNRIAEVQTHLAEVSRVIRESTSKPDSGAGDHQPWPMQ
ncbi:hypothetical protein FOL46_006327 [Perkinsus olseni]|uniref:PX domain-containing protein n=1 Tax=Perkinsus olseni TaxID=32597 RepID=A0A7J6LLL3_PEROL|nr:hypothetical protein FOL46_006327 [Perkinsus olseni]